MFISLVVMQLAAVRPQACQPKPPGVVVGAAARRIDEHVRRLSALGAFDGVVLVARHDTVLLHRGYGWADDATCAAMRPETRFDIASIAKQFTGAAVLPLEQRGRLEATGRRPLQLFERWLRSPRGDRRARVGRAVPALRA